MRLADSQPGKVTAHELRGLRARLAAIPLRSLSGDAEFVASILESIQGPSSR